MKLIMSWDKLHPQTKEDILKRCSLPISLSNALWEDIDQWMRLQINDAELAASYGQVGIKLLPDDLQYL